MKKIAQVIFNLPIDTRFDYSIPSRMLEKVRVGSRVKVSFGNKKLVGYVISLIEKSKFIKLKPIISLLDENPILDKVWLLLLKELAGYYCCSLGEMIETSLPQSIRKAKLINTSVVKKQKIAGEFQVSALKDLSKEERWQIYFDKINQAIAKDKDTIFLVPEINYITDVFDKLNKKFKGLVAILYGSQPRKIGFDQWMKIRQGKAKIVVGVISAIFAPVNNLGLVIVEDEDSHAYKHDQSPHYHAREVALMRAKKNKAEVILSSAALSLETYLAIKKKTYEIVKTKKSRSDKLNVQVLDMKEESFRQRKKGIILSSFLESNIQNTISSQGKTMLFMNRKGFSTFIHCRACGYTLKCPRCNVGLVYHYDKKTLKCRFCNYESKVISICPNCKASYMRYLGLGTEKIESEMHRIFPQAKIRRWDKDSTIPDENFDILISTQISLARSEFSFDLLGVLNPEISLNRIDFRAAEKTYSLLYRLSKLVKGKMIIQTFNSTHYCIQAIYKQNPGYFYKEEMKSRREFGFPPFKHLVQITVRGKNQERVKSVSFSLFNKLNAISKKKNIEIYEPSPSMPSKLRGNYYFNILLKSNSVKNICLLIRKTVLEYKNKSGVVTTVNVDL